MKMKLSLRGLGLATFVVIVLSACNKDESEVILPDSTVEKGIVIDVNSSWNDEPFALNSDYTIDGTTVQFSTFKFYMSNVKAVNPVASQEVSYNRVLLIDAGSGTSQYMGEAPIGSADELTFDIGLDSVTNAGDPTIAETPLNAVDMHWTWNPGGGYKFIRLDGEYDSDGDNVVDTPFSIHAATDDLLREVLLFPNAGLSNTGTITISLDVECSQFFDNIPWEPQNWTGQTHGASNLTHAIATNAATSFSME